MEDNFGYLVAVFAIGWGIFMGLAYWIYRRVARVGQDIKRARNASSGDLSTAGASKPDSDIKTYRLWLSPRMKAIACGIVIAFALAVIISLSIIVLTISREDNVGYLYAGFAIAWVIFMGLASWIYRRVARVSHDIRWLNRAFYTHSND